MTEPCITRCADGHSRRVIYGLGPYIADYPEQALLACIVQNWCPKFAFTFCPNYDTLTIPFGQDAPPHTRTLMEMWEDPVLMLTPTCFSALGQSRCENFGMAMEL